MRTRMLYVVLALLFNVQVTIDDQQGAVVGLTRTRSVLLLKSRYAERAVCGRRGIVACRSL